MITPELPQLSAGCWFDSHHGYHIHAAIITEAHRLGYTLLEPEVALVKKYDTGGLLTHSQHDHVMQLVDEAEDFLSHLVTEDYWIGWNDGDFGMYPLEEDDGPCCIAVVTGGPGVHTPDCPTAML